MTDDWYFYKSFNNEDENVQNYLDESSDLYLPHYKNNHGDTTLSPVSYHFTASWSKASELFDYFTDSRSGLCRDVVTLYGTAEQINKTIQEENWRWNIQPGDLLFWNPDENGNYTHATILTGYDFNSNEFRYSGHSTKRKNDLLSVGWSGYLDEKKSIAIVLLND